jgi:hypothetical protein
VACEAGVTLAGVDETARDWHPSRKKIKKINANTLLFIFI